LPSTKIAHMAALQTFNVALADSCGSGAASWSDDMIARVCELAAKLRDEDLPLLRVIWPNRPTLREKRAAQRWGRNATGLPKR
jgi:hypothetical protein